MNATYHINTEAVVEDAIKARLGNIDGLPDAARQKIRQVYQAFYDAYLKIADFKKASASKDTGKTDAIGFDPDIIEYMQHFFSDYQSIYRDFKFTNHYARALIQAEQNKNSESFERQLNALISGKNDFTEASVMDKILHGNESVAF